MGSHLLTLISLLLVTFCTGNLVIETQSGRLRGDISPRSSRVYRFLGIPYANTPERFEKAEMVTPWNDVRNATSFGSICLQRPTELAPANAMSEDCLTLDVYTPVNLRKRWRPRKRPVMVYIHGGSFVSGSSRIYESSILSEVGDVVVVAIQYRIGVFGFLYTQGQTPTNLGLWDQKLALEWVQQNIHAFGGDKYKVTLFGESAGAMSVSAHMMSPLMDTTLFQKAILQSGSLLSTDQIKFVRDSFVSKMAGQLPHCTTTIGNVSLELECLKQTRADILLAASGSAGVVFWPTSGDSYLPNDPMELLRKYQISGVESIANDVGYLAKYDVLIGHEGIEGIYFLDILFGDTDLTNGLSEQLYHNTLKAGSIQPVTVNPTCIDKTTDIIQYFYDQPFDGRSSRTENEINLKNAVDAAGDFVITIPTILFGMVHSDLARLQKLPSRLQSNTFYYEFDHEPELISGSDNGPAWLKTSATHGDIIQYAFSLNPHWTGFADFSEVEGAMSQTVMKYWTSFAKFRFPISQWKRGGRFWRQFESPDWDYMRLTTTKDIPENRPRGELPWFWLNMLSSIAKDNAKALAAMQG